MLIPCALSWLCRAVGTRGQLPSCPLLPPDFWQELKTLMLIPWTLSWFFRTFGTGGQRGQSSSDTQFLAEIKAKYSPPPLQIFRPSYHSVVWWCTAASLSATTDYGHLERAFFQWYHKCFGQFGQIRPSRMWGILGSIILINFVIVHLLSMIWQIIPHFSTKS